MLAVFRETVATRTGGEGFGVFQVVRREGRALRGLNRREFYFDVTVSMWRWALESRHTDRPELTEEVS